MSKKEKKKSRREKQEFPNLDVKYNLKKRRDYMDNRHYVNGVKNAKGDVVMPKLDQEAKEYLNKFNKEYYNASFSDPWEYDEVHEMKVDKETVMGIKAKIRDLKKKRKRIFDKFIEIFFSFLI